MNEQHPLVTMNDQEIRQPGTGRTLFRFSRFEIADSEIVGLSGESGCGKTIFCRTVRNCTERSYYVAQDYAQTFSPYISLAKQINLVLQHHGQLNGHRKTGHEIAERCGLSEEVYRQALQRVSGGQLQRAALARALAADPCLIIADEISAAQDAVHKMDLICLMGELRESHNISFLVVSHDQRMLNRLCDRQYRIDDGFLREV